MIPAQFTAPSRALYELMVSFTQALTSVLEATSTFVVETCMLGLIAWSIFFALSKKLGLMSPIETAFAFNLASLQHVANPNPDDAPLNANTLPAIEAMRYSKSVGEQLGLFSV